MQEVPAWIEADMEVTGVFIKKCGCYMNINFFRNFHQKVFTLSISIIVLNASVEFVLINRPHPVITMPEEGIDAGGEGVWQGRQLGRLERHKLIEVQGILVSRRQGLANRYAVSYRSHDNLSA
jgi:hypothetical protein